MANEENKESNSSTTPSTDIVKAELQTILAALLTEELGKFKTSFKEELLKDMPKPEAKSKKSDEEEVSLKELHETIKKMHDSNLAKDKLIEEAKTETKLANHKASFVESLTKLGYTQAAAEAVYKVEKASNSLVDDGKGNLSWKVKANGVEVPLPTAEAAKYWAKSELGETLKPAKTNGGGSTTNKETKVDAESTKNKPFNLYQKHIDKVLGGSLEVDWMAAMNDKTGGDGTAAPAFNTSPKYGK
jgi:hypothetical protein